jgi:hypothetical protein
MNNETSELSSTVHQMDLTDIYRIIQQLHNAHSQKPTEHSPKQMNLGHAACLKYFKNEMTSQCNKTRIQQKKFQKT